MNNKITVVRADTTIPEKALVKVIKAGNAITIKWAAKPQLPPAVKKIADGWYLDQNTGEIKQSNENTQKVNYSNLRRSMEDLRNTINANFIGASNELFITLTYAENMTDTEKLYKDCKAFIQRLSRVAGARPLYVNVVEPQQRGAWHCHLLCKWPTKKTFYLSNSQCKSLWGYGFTSVKRLKGIDNIGAYLSAYLTNLNGKKGGRLHLYPKGLKIWRTSRGLAKPKTEIMTYNEAKKMLHPARCSGKRGISVIDTETNKIYNTMVTQFFTMGKEEQKMIVTIEGKMKIEVDTELEKNTNYLTNLVEGIADDIAVMNTAQLE